MYITITKINDYMGVESYHIGQILNLRKEKDSVYDDESIIVENDNGVKYGYVANSVCSVARGTHSAGYIYNTFEEITKCRILFIVEDKVIAELI